METEKNLECMNIAKVSYSGFFKFLLPSTLGVLLFLIPLKINGEATLLINVIINATKAFLGTMLVPFIILILFISAVCSTVGLLKPDIFKGFFRSLFVINPFMVFVRVFAVIIAILAYLQVGPEMIWSNDTGGFMLNSVLTILVPFFLWAGIMLPLLTHFGLIEFIGVFTRGIFRPLFKIPDRSALNCTVAWVGSGSMGIVLTNQEYENGFYTGREAIRIATGFSVVSVPIVAILAGFLDLQHLFPLLYGSLIFTAVIVNIIVFRIPPISRKPDEYMDGAPKRTIDEKASENIGVFKWALLSGIKRAEEKKNNLIKGGFKITADIWFTLEPIVLVLGTVVTIISVYTSFFKWISYPFIPVLNLLGLEDATNAAPSIVLGFVDIFLPFIVGAGIDSVETKFVIALVALNQVIMMTEGGPLLLKSSIPINFLDIVKIFMLRTLLTLPIAAGLAHIFSFLNLL
ncbi:YjiH family protein [Peribacillus butanolivorans]|uniref:YjiH family protein n=1 Tax=Peribacillus butanolivorans TaxID=421767 RepID=UPI00365963F8